MSRIGKRPIVIPEKVNVKINGSTVIVKGPKGNLDFSFAKGVNVEQKDKTLIVTPLNPETKEGKSLWGLTRTLIDNMVVGVTTGFVKGLEFTGVGYRAVVKGQILNLNLGYSHPIDYKIPEGVTITTKGNKIDVAGCDKSLVGFVAAQIRSYRPPEPYKGKGIKYATETIIRKAGKSAAKGK